MNREANFVPSFILEDDRGIRQEKETQFHRFKFDSSAMMVRKEGVGDGRDRNGLLKNGAGTRGRRENERVLVVVQVQEASI